jgi:AcrR family transcriptional regulator
MARAKKRVRPYASVLRDQQSSATRSMILDAVAGMFAQKPTEELSTKQIAERAGVSEPTIYRHFPDREALINALAHRLLDRADAERGPRRIETLEDFIDEVGWYFEQSDAHVSEAMADAMLSADPRRLSDRTRKRLQEIDGAVRKSLPELSPRDQHRIAALLRTIASAPTWLRMREEFGLASSESAPLVVWALKTLVQAARKGTLPKSGRTG